MGLPPLPTKPGIYIVDDDLHEDAIIYRLYPDGWFDCGANQIDPRDLPKAAFRRLVVAAEDVKTRGDYHAEMLQYLASHGVDSSTATIDYNLQGYVELGSKKRVAWPDGFDVPHFDHLWRGSVGHFEPQ